MTLIERLHIRSRREPAADTTSPISSPGEETLPIASYDDLHEKQVIAHFRELSQVDLAEIEGYERAHLNRRPVLDKLRYMRSPEPLPGYDTLESREVVQLIEGASLAEGADGPRRSRSPRRRSLACPESADSTTAGRRRRRRARPRRC